MDSYLFQHRKKIRLDTNPTTTKISIKDLPTAILSHITTFSSIEDYVFGLLLVSKHFHHSLSPFKSPFIIKQLIQNQCHKILDDVNPFIDLHKLRAKKKNLNPITIWKDWILSASYAWVNNSRLPRIQHPLKKDFYGPFHYKDLKHHWLGRPRNSNQHPIGEPNSSVNDKKNALSSSLYLMNFMHKIRFGGLSKHWEIKHLILKLLSSCGGALGLRYMLWFYLEEFAYGPLRKNGKAWFCEKELDEIIFRELSKLYNVFYLFCFGEPGMDPEKEWYMGQILRDLDKLLYKYRDVMVEFGIEKFKDKLAKLDLIKTTHPPHFYQKYYVVFNYQQ